jgi:hypothetical protein
MTSRHKGLKVPEAKVRVFPRSLMRTRLWEESKLLLADLKGPRRSRWKRLPDLKGQGC